MVTWPCFKTNWNPSAAAGGARLLPGVHDVPCPHPWLGIASPPSAPPDEVAPELLPALASSPPPPEEPLLDVEPELLPDDEPLLPLEFCPPEELEVESSDPPELLLGPGFELNGSPSVVDFALHPAKPSEAATSDSKANRDTMALRFMTTPRFARLTDC